MRSRPISLSCSSRTAEHWLRHGRKVLERHHAVVFERNVRPAPYIAVSECPGCVRVTAAADHVLEHLDRFVVG